MFLLSRTEAEAKLPDVMDVTSPVRKVPVRIVHAESSSEREGRAYLPQSNETCSIFKPLSSIASLGATDSPSLFSAYSRQAAQDSGHAAASGLPGDEGPSSSSSSKGARRSEEDTKREELARDIMGRDKSLVDILDQSGRRTTMDLMEGLFPAEDQILEGTHQRRRASAGSRLPTPARWAVPPVSAAFPFFH